MSVMYLYRQLASTSVYQEISNISDIFCIIPAFVLFAVAVAPEAEPPSDSSRSLSSNL